MINNFTFFGRCYLLNDKGTRSSRTYCINTTRVKLYWRLLVKLVQVREAGRWIFVTFLWQIKFKKEIYRSNISQQIICGYILWQIQRKEKSLGTLKTTYLVEMNKYKLVSEGHCKKKYTHKLENVSLIDISKYNKWY